MDASSLETEINEKLDDGPFGPVEFTAYVEESENGFELFISHFKVHEEYRGQGLGEKSIKKAVEMAYDSDLNIETVSIDMGGGDDTRGFLESIGFEDIRTHSEEQVSAVADVKSLIKSL